MSDDPYERQKRHLEKKRDAGWRQVKIDLPPDQLARLDAKAEAEGLSRTAYVKAAVIAELKAKDEA